jgi:protein O-mannosyl-transferase
MRRSSKNHNKPREASPASPAVVSAASRGNGAGVLLAAGSIVVVCALAYSNTFGVPFIFDDIRSITDNPTIKRLWPLWQTLLPPEGGEAVQRRPVANVSLAINYAVSGEKVWSYHALNLAAHISAALLLFGVVRRTLNLNQSVGWDKRSAVPPTAGESVVGLCSACPTLPLSGTAATLLAAAIALLWAVHPLQTEAVTYIVQRTEVLAGLFFLLTLYCVIRGFSSPKPIVWYTAAVLSCALAVGSKESAVSAPVVVLLYDRIFLCPSWREIFRRHWGLYAGLAASWIIVLVMLPHGNEGTAIFGRGGQGFDYLLSQGGVIVHYLRLSFWPHPLVLDYGFFRPQPVGQVLPYALLVGGLLLAVGVAFRYRPWLGFLGIWFFAILAPSSSIIPVTMQIAAEKRMYLPLAAVITVVVLGGYFAQQRLVRRKILPASTARWVFVSLATMVVVIFGVLTYQRNAVFGSDVSIWEDTMAKAPDNPRAHNNYGTLLAQLGQYDKALVHFLKALKIQPEYPDAHNNLALLYFHQGRDDEAETHFRKAQKIKPDYANAYFNYGALLANSGRFDEAAVQYRKTLDFKPNDLTARKYLEEIEVERNKLALTFAEMRRTIEVHPDDATLLNNAAWRLATCPCRSMRNGIEAVKYAERALKLSENREPAMLDTLAAAYAEAGRFDDAVRTAQEAAESAKRQNNRKLVESIESRIRLYQTGKPYCESPPAPSEKP